MNSDIIIVSGLPRSGTSLMMQMLERGGVPVVTDGLRTSDDDNPRGYFEFEPVKKLRQNSAWLADARGKAVKIISQLLFDLPSSERYRIVMMERSLDEVLASQETMLARLGRPAAPREPITRSFQAHLQKLDAWLATQANIEVLRVPYATLIAAPQTEAARINEFLDGALDADAMAEAVDPALYRNRQS